jgi:excisionase family DNA binding protein
MTAKDHLGAEATAPDSWLTRKQAATYLKLGESTLAKLFVSGGGPPAIKIGRAVRYSILDLDSWMSNHRRRSTSDHPEMR